MRAKFLSNLFILILLNLVVKPFWLLGVDRAVQNALGKEDYGIYFALMNFSILFSSLLDLGVSAYNNRNIAQHHFLLSKYFPKLIHIKLALSCLYVLTISLVGFLVGYQHILMQLLLVLGFNQILLSLILFLRSNLGGLLLFKKDSIISVTDKILLIAFCGGLLLYKDGIHLSLWTFVLSQTAAYLLTFLLAFLFLRGKLKFKKLKLRPLPYLAILKESYPYAILVLLMALYSRTDAIMLERLLDNGAEQAGVYASAYRILEAFSMIAYLFSTLLLPLFSKMLKNRLELDNLVGTAFKLLATFAVVAAVAVAIYSKEWVNLLYPQSGKQVVLVMSMLIFSIIPISLTYIFGTLLTAGAKLKFLNRMAVGGVLLNFLLNLWLIPRYQAQGAVFSTLLTQALTAGVQIFAAYRYFKFSLKIGVWMKVLLVALIGATVGYLLRGQLQWEISIFIVLACQMIFGISVGLLNPKSAISLLKSKGK